MEARRERLREDVKRRKSASSFKPRGAKELILLIIERLAGDDHNCREICDTQGLLSKITAPITSRAFLDAVCEDDDVWFDILSTSLRVLARLISSPGEASTRLLQETSTSQDMEPALQILAQVALGPYTGLMTKEEFVSLLRDIFFGNKDNIEEKSRRYGTVVDQLTEMLVKDKQCQISAAAILEHLCSRFLKSCQLSKQDAINLLTTVLGLILSSNTERNAVAGSDSSNYAGAATEARGSDYSAIARDEESQPPKDAVQDKSPTEQDDILSQEKKLLAALLSFTMVICEKLIDADDFSNVAHVDRELLKKLIEIIDVNNDATADCLRIMKLSCQVAILAIQHKPSCAKDFNEHDRNHVLTKASENLLELDKCMFFAGNDHEAIKPARSLSSLVKEAQERFKEAQARAR
ncbi:hypothetical protein OsJ_26975 [Oryza sativa Japonica Group]|uniref:Uncharacterized protein n=1 Tax=Oryza sativa subsp. japonica TaxID=39947 RepID=B9G0G4_ORYSJ|nr:hypothetical protein OsJ_26975 [Oryza sativa Japonica Group]